MTGRKTDAGKSFDEDGFCNTFSNVCVLEKKEKYIFLNR